MSNLLSKPSQFQDINTSGLYERFNLLENPFPSEPTVNKESMDKRINGDIYELQIRNREFKLIKDHFLSQPQANANHLKLGYIIDTSYIGRGNGKTAFLINLLNIINKDYCLDLSDKKNKCFAVYVSPEPGGRTKTFPSFVDCLFDSILKSNIISICLTTLRLEAINTLRPDIDFSSMSETEIIENLNNHTWYTTNKIPIKDIGKEIFKNNILQNLPDEFPLFNEIKGLYPELTTQNSFEQYYSTYLKKPKEKLDFIFSHLIRLFTAANFNGAYILVDDFERIPDFQSSRQKRDFALELRLCLFDGYYLNAKLGFYNFLLVLHAGVPRLISDAWAESGLENRAPISQLTYKNIISFEKLTIENAILLLKKYLSEYRIKTATKVNEIYPFTSDAVTKIGELSEYNAAKMLRMAYELLDKAANDKNQNVIDQDYIIKNRGSEDTDLDNVSHSINNAPTIDLIEKAVGQE